MKRLLSIVTLPIALLAIASPADPRPQPAHAPTKLTRYSIVHGCYSLQLASGRRLGPYRMQATALAQYLLYDRGQHFLAADLSTGDTPSPDSTWQVDGRPGRRFTLVNLGTGEKLPVTLTPAGGCAIYPEAEVDAAGNTFRGRSSEADVLGTVEGHAHVTAFEFLGGDFHCGRPWHPYGAAYALPDCAPDEQGSNGEFESFIDFGGPNRPSDMKGWPTFRNWPSPTALAEEGDYYTGIERAWKAGLRVMVTQLVDNQALCTLMSTKHNPCNDMDDVRIQSRDLYALQNYIDAQSGGPGKGFFRIVTDPFQARKVINEGKLAVVEGIEMSEIFGCGEYNDAPECGQSQIDAGLKEVHDLGVRTFFPIHEFNNAFGGTKMIAGELGTVVNAGNRDETGSFWTLQPCPAQDQDAEQSSVPQGGALAGLLNGPVAGLLHGNPVPVYGPGPQCNTRGLTDLGSYVINQMIKQHFVIQLDHMDSKTADAALSIAQAQHYAGVVSAHCCSSPQLFRRIYSTGGFISEPVGPANSFIATERTDKALSSPRYHFGFGWGSDMNGLAEQPGASSGSPISYPFHSFAGHVSFTREQWGQRTFDLNTDGLANYGLYADWLRDLQLVGGQPVVNDMFQGAEAYLEMWERADGVRPESCLRSSGLMRARGAGPLRLGDGLAALLYGAGQPRVRTGRAYRYCVSGVRRGGLTAVFGRRGRVAIVVSTAGRYGAHGVHPGSRFARVRRTSRPLGHGLWLRRRSRLVYAVRGGRVRWVAVVSRTDARRTRLLRADLRAAGVRP